MENNLIFASFYVPSFTFQDVIYKNNSDLLLCHIYIINTNTDSKPNGPWNSLLLTWKIHGILCHKRSGNPASVLTHFKIFITKICMKVPGIWHKKLEQIWNLGPKTLRKPGVWYLEKCGNLGFIMTISGITEKPLLLWQYLVYLKSPFYYDSIWYVWKVPFTIRVSGISEKSLLLWVVYQSPFYYDSIWYISKVPFTMRVVFLKKSFLYSEKSHLLWQYLVYMKSPFYYNSIWYILKSPFYYDSIWYNWKSHLLWLIYLKSPIYYDSIWYIWKVIYYDSIWYIWKFPFTCTMIDIFEIFLLLWG